MRDYGRVHSAFWTSQDIRCLSDDARLLALYLLTSPHTTIVGAFRLPDGYVCEDMQWSTERVSKGLTELFSKGFANRCETTKWVWIRKFLEWNAPENPNQWKAARKIASQIPDQCTWKADFYRCFARAAGDKEPPESEPFPNPSETVSESGTGTGTGTGTGDTPPSVSASAKKKRATTRKPEVLLPDDFSVDVDLARYATERLPDVDAPSLDEQFRLQAKTKQWRYADWRLAFMTYVRNAMPQSGHFAAGQYPRKSVNTRIAVPRDMPDVSPNVWGH